MHFDWQFFWKALFTPSGPFLDGLTLTIVISVLNILSAAPGLAFAPTPTLKVLATIGVVGFAAVILLAILPGPRRTYT